MMRWPLRKVPGLVSVLACAVATLWPAMAGADVKLPVFFSEGMVLQQGMEVPVWGWADVGEKVTVSFAGQEKQAAADAEGKWMVRLENLTATRDQTGQQMVVKGNNTITINDVLIGEVWFCSGQSNMAWNVNNTANAKEEVAAADFPMIRHFRLTNTLAEGTQMTDARGSWLPATPRNVGNFSGTAYYFGRRLHRELGIPIGLINNSVGGTPAEAWTSREALFENLPQYKSKYADWVDPGTKLKEQMEVYEASREAYNKKLTELYALEDDMQAAAGIADPIHDDTDWQTMAIPGAWESAGLKDVDGMVWFRKTIVVPAQWAGKELTLHLGPVDEIDVTFFNGSEIGRTGQMRGWGVAHASKPREYQVPGELVKAGSNVIAVRVIDSRNLGGIFGGKAAQMTLKPADGSDKNALSLAGEWRYKLALQLPVMARSPASTKRPTVLYNALVHPLIPYAIRGAIWYQGEANSSRHEEYATLLPTMIQDWRSRWGQGDYPFYIVQLAGFRVEDTKPADHPWPNFREVQRQVSLTVPNSAMASAIDIGEAGIHPANKQDVGDRLARIALAKDYGKDVVWQGPTFKEMTIEGNQARIHFDHAQGGLVNKGDEVANFAIAGEDGVFVWAEAKIEGDTVVVSAKGVEKPVSVRYAWSNMPKPMLYNSAGLPAVPFATDKMKK